MHDNPFAALTLIAAPAVLTNASSLLALGTSNRFARAVDRQRQLSALLDKEDGNADAELSALRLKQLHTAERRAELVLRALSRFYLSLACFAGAALVSLLGAVVTPDLPGVVAGIVRVAALVVGLVGVGGLVTGCSLLVRETRMTLRSLREEAAFTHRSFRRRHSPAVEKREPVVAEPTDRSGSV